MARRVLRPQLRAAVAALMAAVMKDLADSDEAPIFGAIPDFRGWHRHGQEVFVALRQDAWQMPKRVSRPRFLDDFTEMTVVRAAVESDDVLRERVDRCVGVEFSLQDRQLGWTLVQHLLQPMVYAVRGYLFDQAAFDDAYSRLEAGLLATNAEMVEFVPFNAFTTVSGLDEIVLPENVVLRAMTDGQMSAAIGSLAVPTVFTGGPTTVSVSRFDQWALTRQTSYPVYSEADMPAQPNPAVFPSLVEPAAVLVTALRLVCGGSVVATRAILQQHDDDFPLLTGPSVSLSAVPATDEERPTVLFTADVETVCQVYGYLTHSAVAGSRALQTALRRLVLAGAHREATDRLIDLMICAEALFIKLPGLPPHGSKQDKIVAGAVRVLTSDPALQAPPQRVESLLRLGYRLRNDQVHGDDPSQRQLYLLNGEPTSHLSAVVNDIERVMRRAVVRVLADTAKR